MSSNPRVSVLDLRSGRRLADMVNYYRRRRYITLDNLAHRLGATSLKALDHYLNGRAQWPADVAWKAAVFVSECYGVQATPDGVVTTVQTEGLPPSWWQDGMCEIRIPSERNANRLEELLKVHERSADTAVTFSTEPPRCFMPYGMLEKQIDRQVPANLEPRYREGFRLLERRRHAQMMAERGRIRRIFAVPMDALAALCTDPYYTTKELRAYFKVLGDYAVRRRLIELRIVDPDRFSGYRLRRMWSFFEMTFVGDRFCLFAGGPGGFCDWRYAENSSQRPWPKWVSDTHYEVVSRTKSAMVHDSTPAAVLRLLERIGEIIGSGLPEDAAYASLLNFVYPNASDPCEVLTDMQVRHSLRKGLDRILKK